MALSEFDVIGHYFKNLTPPGPDVAVGIGDDGAVLRPPPGTNLVVSTDTLVEGVHFAPGADAVDLGFKALAVNLSDLAAMGAEPLWFSLALTLPAADALWLEGFARGLSELAQRHKLKLIGGDTTRGPLSLTLTVHGAVPDGQALLRSGARGGDPLFVSGTIGDAALALLRRQAGEPLSDQLAAALDRPIPRASAGMALRSLATAAIDVSDGLLADLGHLCEASGLGAELEVAQVPLSDDVSMHVRSSGDWDTILGGGEDYELLFTVPVGRQHEVAELARRVDLGMHRIGRMIAGRGASVRLPDGSHYRAPQAGFDHFRAT